MSSGNRRMSTAFWLPGICTTATFWIIDRIKAEMLHLPYQCQPYPDEILGSWLARIRLHNNTGAWKSILELSGYGKHLNGSMFDTIDFNPRVGVLLETLETTYEEVLANMTTLPYWLAFGAAETAVIAIQGSKTLRQLHEIQSYEALLFRSHGDEFRPPRYCPKCLLHDLEQHGELYWHRCHQLPNVFVCIKHQTALRTTCQACGRRVVASGMGLMPLPGVKCPCGQDTSQIAESRSLPSAYLRLAQVSAEALKLSFCSWSTKDVRAYFRQVVYARTGTPHVHRSMLTDTFGAISWSGSSPDYKSAPPIEAGGLPPLRLKHKLSEARAPECCALLTALDISLTAAVVGFTSSQPQPSTLVKHSHPTPKSLPIEVARASLLDKISKGKRPSIQTYIYWYLRIKDSKWMREHFTALYPIPPKEDDRKTVLRRADNSELSERLRRARISSSPAGIRASIRDHPWYSAQLERLTQQQLAYSAKHQIARYREYAAQVEGGIYQLLRKPGQPRLIAAYTLARATGLARDQVRNAFKVNPALRELFQAVNARLVERQLLWALKEVQEVGQSLSPSRILRCAKMETTHANYALVRSILDACVDKTSLHASFLSRCEFSLPARILSKSDSYDDVGVSSGSSERQQHTREMTSNQLRKKFSAYRDEILQMRTQGVSLDGIAKDLGLSRHTISFWLQLYKSSSYAKDTKSYKCDPSDVVRLRREGKTYNEIAISLNVPVSTVSSMLAALRLLNIDEQMGSYRGAKFRSIDISKIVELRHGGLTYAEISGRTGIPPRIAGSVFRAYSGMVEGNWIDGRCQPSKARAVLEPDKIMSLREQGLSFARIGSITGNSRWTARSYFYAHSSQRPRKRVPVDPDKILSLRGKGYSFETIGLALGVSEYTAWRHFKSLPDVDPRLKESIKYCVPCTPSDVINLRRQGLSMSKIVRRLKISKSTAYRLLHKAISQRKSVAA